MDLPDMLMDPDNPFLVVPADVDPADEDPADVDPADEDPADEDPADEDPADEETADVEQSTRSTFPAPETDNPYNLREVLSTVDARFNEGPNTDAASTPEEEATLGDIIESRLRPLRGVVTRRRTFFDQHVKGWDRVVRAGVMSASGATVLRVKSPTASGMRYEVLHPAIYRFLEPLSTLDAVATHLNVPGWRQEVDRLWNRCRNDFNAFVGSDDDVAERLLQKRLQDLIHTISKELPRNCVPDGRDCAIVRGTLSRDNYEVRGVADLVYSSDGRFILATELKTANSWPADHYWYRGSRGVQTFNALYAFKCPTLLINQHRFKLFVENHDRNGVLTFPAEDSAANASADAAFWATLSLQPTRDVLFHILVICLMCAGPISPTGETSKPQVVKAPGFVPSNQVAQTETPQRPADNNGAPASDDSTTADRSPTNNRMQRPTAAMSRFFTGKHDANGERVYRTVHVSPPSADPKAFSISSEDDDIIARVDSAILL